MISDVDIVGEEEIGEGVGLEGTPDNQAADSQQSPGISPEERDTESARQESSHEMRRRLFREELEEQKDVFWGILRNRLTDEEIKDKAEELLTLKENKNLQPEEILEKAKKELIAEAARQFLQERELVIHRRSSSEAESWGKEGITKSDLDAKCAVGLLSLAGINISEGSYVAPGEFKRGGAVNLDSGYMAGIQFRRNKPMIKEGESWDEAMIREKIEEEELMDEVNRLRENLGQLESQIIGLPDGEEKLRKKEDIKQINRNIKQKSKQLSELWKKESIIFDHHLYPSHRETSTTQIVYEVLRDFGLFHFRNRNEEKAIENLVDFVTDIDNARFDRYSGKKNFMYSWKTMLGLNRWVSFENLLQFFKDGKRPIDELGVEKLKKYKLNPYIIRRGTPEEKAVDYQKQQREMISRASETINKLEKRGWVLEDEKGERYLVDMQFYANNGKETPNTGPLGPWAAASFGYAGLLRYTPGRGFAFYKSNGEFDDKMFEGLPQGTQGINIRGGSYLQPLDKEKLLIRLNDLIGRIAPNFVPKKGSELEKFLDNEERVVRTVVTRNSRGFWYSNDQKGDFIIVRGETLPLDIKSGNEGYLRILDPNKNPKEANKQEQERGFPPKYYLAEWITEEESAQEEEPNNKGPVFLTEEERKRLERVNERMKEFEEWKRGVEQKERKKEADREEKERDAWRENADWEKLVDNFLSAQERVEEARKKRKEKNGVFRIFSKGRKEVNISFDEAERECKKIESKMAKFIEETRKKLPERAEQYQRLIEKRRKEREIRRDFERIQDRRKSEEGWLRQRVREGSYEETPESSLLRAFFDAKEEVIRAKKEVAGLSRVLPERKKVEDRLKRVEEGFSRAEKNISDFLDLMERREPLKVADYKKFFIEGKNKKKEELEIFRKEELYRETIRREEKDAEDLLGRLPYAEEALRRANEVGINLREAQSDLRKVETDIQDFLRKIPSERSKKYERYFEIGKWEE